MLCIDTTDSPELSTKSTDQPIEDDTRDDSTADATNAKENVYPLEPYCEPFQEFATITIKITQIVFISAIFSKECFIFHLEYIALLFSLILPHKILHIKLKSCLSVQLSH